MGGAKLGGAVESGKRGINRGLISINVIRSAAC